MVRYTIVYIIEQGLKRKGIHNLEKLVQTCCGMNIILDLVEAANMEKSSFRDVIDDSAFYDLEASFQYQCALVAQCDVFITINIRDFKQADFTIMDVMTPQVRNRRTLLWRSPFVLHLAFRIFTVI